MLWYQGESDANPEAAKIYPKVFAGFINSVRSDLGAPDLPFYLVQIGRVIRAGDPTAWNAVQDAQRRIPDRVPEHGGRRRRLTSSSTTASTWAPRA